MNHARREEDQQNWLRRTFTFGDFMAMLASIVMITVSFSHLQAGVQAAERKAASIEERIERTDIRTQKTLDEIKVLIIRLDDKVNRANEAR